LHRSRSRLLSQSMSPEPSADWPEALEGPVNFVPEIVADESGFYSVDPHLADYPAHALRTTGLAMGY
ncbi:hypothetical protein, partial [Agrobacterium pusense]|uniref:hypothetical protein n=1 Tax=Agrobacterium pusense TaxID=648995 RepID=UPI001AECB17E